MDPNSQNQLWSRWTFDIHEGGRRVPSKDVEYNIARWLTAGFGSVGRVRVLSKRFGWRVQVDVEGKPAHDPAYVERVRQQFAEHFVGKGWGSVAWSRVSVRVLAGSEQDGQPSKQWVEMPTIPLEAN